MSVVSTTRSGSQGTRPLGRLLWKEYRQQRSLWLVILAMGLVLQLAFRVLLSSVASSASSNELIGVVWGVSLFMPLFFLVGSSAMLFSLEREERTSDWLVGLATPPGWTLLAKYGFAIVATLTLCGAMLLWALVLTIGHPFPLAEFDSPARSEGWKLFTAGLTFGIACLFFLAWGTLGSLTSRRVVEAVPVALVWWVFLGCVPMGVVSYWMGGQLSASRNDWVMQQLLGVLLLVVVAADVWLGWRWCRGKYLDAQFLDDLNQSLSARRKGRATRIPARVESEFSAWRTWQRLVWQERHRESLHLGLLSVVCAVGVLLALYSMTQRESITAASIGLIVLLPVAMGVLGFRFDSAGQQLRFLAHRGTSPLAIWCAKQVVWLPRAFWIPAVAWGVACLAEWLFIPPTPETLVIRQHPWGGDNHPVWFATGQMLPHWELAVWFVLLSYAAGQLTAMLLRQFVIAAAASLVLSGLLAGWLALMFSLEVPLWWSVGSLGVWLFWLTWWYSGPWLLERRTWLLACRLSALLVVPPLLLMGTVAMYRWLEVSGGADSTPRLFALLYPHEAARRALFLDVNDSMAGEGLTAAVARLKQPVSDEAQQTAQRLAALTRGFNTVAEFRQQLETATGSGGLAIGSGGLGSATNKAVAAVEQPADALMAIRDPLARAAFWKANESRLKEILDLANRDRCDALDQYVGLGIGDTLMPQQRLLLEGARLCRDDGQLKEALDYCCASLRLATFRASGRLQASHWSEGDRQQAETLQAIVDWANDQAAENESLLPAIRRVREELARFPSVRDLLVTRYFNDVARLNELQRNSFEHPFGPAVGIASFLPSEVARAQRVLDQELFWSWQHFRSLELLLPQPGVNAPRWFTEGVKQDAGFARDERLRRTTPLAGLSQPLDDEQVMQQVVDREVVIRETLLALALLEWRRVHNDWPDHLFNLGSYCVIEKEPESGRVLPVMMLNDPWTGALFEFYGVNLRTLEAKYDGPIGIVYSSGPDPKGTAARSVNATYRENIDLIGGSGGLPMIQTQRGKLSLVLRPNPKPSRMRPQ